MLSLDMLPTAQLGKLQSQPEDVISLDPHLLLITETSAWLPDS